MGSACVTVSPRWTDRVALVSGLLALCACAHAGPTNLVQRCIASAQADGVSLVGAPDSEALMFGPEVMTEMVWKATDNRPQVLCVFYGRRLHALRIGAEAAAD